MKKVFTAVNGKRGALIRFKRFWGCIVSNWSCYGKIISVMLPSWNNDGKGWKNGYLQDRWENVVVTILDTLVVSESCNLLVPRRSRFFNPLLREKCSVDSKIKKSSREGFSLFSFTFGLHYLLPLQADCFEIRTAFPGWREKTGPPGQEGRPTGPEKTPAPLDRFFHFPDRNHALSGNTTPVRRGHPAGMPAFCRKQDSPL